MPDRPVGGAGLLFRIASLLPREVRERVFEPAWADLLLDESAAVARGTDATRHGRRFQRLVSRCVLVLESLRIAVPGLLWRHGRMRRGAKVAIALVLTASILILMARYGYDTAAGPDPTIALPGTVSPG